MKENDFKHVSHYLRSSLAGISILLEAQKNISGKDKSFEILANQFKVLSYRIDLYLASQEEEKPKDFAVEFIKLNSFLENIIREENLKTTDLQISLKEEFKILSEKELLKLALTYLIKAIIYFAKKKTIALTVEKELNSIKLVFKVKNTRLKKSPLITDLEFERKLLLSNSEKYLNWLGGKVKLNKTKNDLLWEVNLPEKIKKA
ncbi:MAG TPA: hypothetical protein VLE47_01355 [Candidatus Saccharimonadales bacterium]|nr:hypothetical protein [Candidatus Saccharimonadales bacterium]